MAERETPWEDPLGSGRIPQGPPPLSLPRKSSENLEEVPRIWEGEGSWRSEILNPINNDYWVLKYQWAARPRGRSAAPLEAFLGSSDMSETGRRSQALLCCVHVFNVLQSFVFVLRSRTFSFVVIIFAKFYYLSVFFLLGNDIHTYCFI